MEFNFVRRSALAILFAFAITASQAYAQLLQGTLNGNVTDSSDAAVAGATVTAQNQAAGVTREATTNSSGQYTVATLPPGTYVVTVKASGFQTYNQTGVIVNGN